MVVMRQHNAWCVCMATPRTHTKHYAASSPPLTFYIFKFSDFNKEPTSSLKMIRIKIETCWSVFKCFKINILD